MQNQKLGNYRSNSYTHPKKSLIPHAPYILTLQWFSMNGVFEEIQLMKGPITWNKIPVDDKNPRLFERTLATCIQPSIIAIACGTDRTNSPNIVGTGFGIRSCPGEDRTSFFVTCQHVMDHIGYLKKLDKPELSEEGLIDNKTRIYVYKECKELYQKWYWQELPDGALKTVSILQEDISIFQITGIEVSPLDFSQEGKYILGDEVGIIGFPTGGNLQACSVQPFVVKTIISSILEYKFEREVMGIKEDVTCYRLALGHPLASGFSGSPVFSILENGIVLGVIDFTPFEEEEKYCRFEDEEGRQRQGYVYGHYPAFTSLAIPSYRIQLALKMHSQLKKKYMEKIDNCTIHQNKSSRLLLRDCLEESPE
jgi:hypothetical protein